MSESNRVLQTPKGMKPLSNNMAPADAYVAAIANLSVAITALVERMEGIETRLDEIGGELSVLSRYAERNGNIESLWTPDDSELFDKGESDGVTETTPAS
jgi:hypothetical protein